MGEFGATAVSERWSVQLFGALEARRGDWHVTRFRSQKTARLFAYLAFYSSQDHPREALTEMLWAESAIKHARNSLCKALSSLRHQLEPPGVERGSVVGADRRVVRINPRFVVTDVATFEQATVRAKAADFTDLELVQAALASYQGQLLSGLYDDWVLRERERLQAMFLRLAHEAVTLYQKLGRVQDAVVVAQRAMCADPLREGSCRDLMAAYLDAGEPLAAMRCFVDFASAYEAEIGTAPSEETQLLAREVERRLDSHQLHAVPGKTWRSPFSAGAEDAAHAFGAADEAEPLEGLSELRGLPLGDLIGREQEVARVEVELAVYARRLVTITGLGGVGKTAVASHVARKLADHGSRVWFVPLAELTDGALVPEAILDVLGLPRDVEQSFGEQLACVLARESRPVLILDNFEHVVEPGAGVVRDLLEAAPNLRCLVTSRRALAIDGECEVVLEPLAVGAGDGEVRSQSVAAQMLVHRLRSRRPDFPLTAQHMDDLERIAARLEGLPLALVLAAGRLQVLSPAQLLGRLSDRLGMLVARGKAVGERHRSLRAALEWSYGLLGEPGKRFFAQLSVFRGSFSLEAAEAVCEAPMALDQLSDLCECSLVHSFWVGDDVRFELLESVREFADSKLGVEERITVRACHVRYYSAETCQRCEQAIDGETMAWMSRNDANLRAGLQTALEVATAVADGVRLGGWLAVYWSVRGRTQEGLRWLTALLKCKGGEPAPRARLAASAAGLAINAHLLDAATAFVADGVAVLEGVETSAAESERIKLLHMELSLDRLAGDRGSARDKALEAMARSRKLGDGKQIAASLLRMAAMRMESADQCARWLDEAIVILRAQRQHPALAEALYLRGFFMSFVENSEGAQLRWSESASLSEAMGHELAVLRTRNAIVLDGYRNGALALSQALEQTEALLARAQGAGDARVTNMLASSLGRLATDGGQWERAEALLQQAYRFACERGNVKGQAEELKQLAQLAHAQVYVNKAQALVDKAQSLYMRSLQLCAHEGGVGSAGFVAGLLAQLALVEAERDQHAWAAKLLAKARELFETSGQAMDASLAERVDAVVSKLAQVLGQDAYAKALEVGNTTPWRELVAPAIAAFAKYGGAGDPVNTRSAES